MKGYNNLWQKLFYSYLLFYKKAERTLNFVMPWNRRHFAGFMIYIDIVFLAMSL